MSRRNTNSRNNMHNDVKSQLNALKSSLHGHSNEFAAIAPKGFTRKPFNTITVESLRSSYDTFGSHIVTLQELIGDLRAQLALSGEVTTGDPTADPPTPLVTLNNLCVKIKRIDIFAKPPGGDKVCSVRGHFYSLVPLYGLGPSQIGAQMPMKSLEDVGLEGAEYAKVSYTYPRDQSDMPLCVVVDQPGVGHLAVCKVTPGSKTDTVVIRYHLLWNTGVEQDGQVTYPTEAALAA